MLLAFTAAACCFNTTSVFGLDVVLLASPFSTLAFTLTFPADVPASVVAVEAQVAADWCAAAHDDTVLVDVVVFTMEDDFLELLPVMVCGDDVDLNVGVTVAEGLLDAKGLMGVVVVDEPTTLGKGAVVVLDAGTGFT